MDKAKLDRWAELLLDTGKRNNLINFRDTKASTVEIVIPSADEIFDKVESSTTFEVYDPKLEDEDEDLNGNSSADPNQNNNEENEKSDIESKEEYTNKYSSRIKKSKQILLYNASVSPIKALKNIDKKARGFLEETGVNVAYIAFGFIHWKENENSEFIYRAPILLAPITIENDSAVDPWFIKMNDEDVILNPTFNFKLINDFNVKLPEYQDDGLGCYFDKIEEIISKVGKDWFVSRECKIGIFSFLKINMYNDLKNNKDKILNNQNVKTLLGESSNEGGFSMRASEHHLENPLVELHNVVDADSSQIEAIEMAKSGTSFVLQGPPGTGKSQTITNIIAECIHDGKKVLFV